ncbi:hypothetical protein [Gluconacetobacter sp.]|uniref:hypothetical protein n=1 Tax=Gluconacetobacter sp. TaxID=1935994 RepID=UPI0039E88337
MDIERAIEVALQAHKGQRDKGGAPYILHPLRVMLGTRTHDEQVVAVLHDVVEDSAWSLDELTAYGLTPVQAVALDALTRRSGETYEQFITRAGKNSIGQAVKILDLRDNMDLSRIPHPSAADRRRIEKYQRALTALVDNGSGDV